VEADGSQHIESSYDLRRDAYLRARGWTILRFWNHEIRTNLDGVLSTISRAIER
jgi:BirA family biotin operon repressor/biotin-[acetyl-CoA-carboxylase] ligase